jgi:hypothetical protein
MRKALIVFAAMLVGVVGAGLTSAIAATGVALEETLVLGEHTLKGRSLDLVGGADDFRPGDRYLFRSRLTQDAEGFLYVDCSVHFGKRDQCSQVYDIAGRGTIVAQGLIPVSELVPGGTWTLAITGGTGDFENAAGSVAVVIVNDEGDTEHTLHVLP